METQTKRLLACGSLGSLLFVTSFLIQGAVREGYSALRHPVSSLAIGELGGIQMASFILAGGLVIVSAFGFRRAMHPGQGSVWTPRFIGLAGLGLVGAGIFSTDPVFGYPTTQPLAVAQFTWMGHLHDLFSIMFFVGLPTAAFKLRNRFRAAGQTGWAAFSMASAICMLAIFLLAGIGFKQTPGLVEYAGLFQRMSIVIGLGWLSSVALHLRLLPPKP